MLSHQGRKIMKVPLPQVKEGRVLADWVTASLREAILNGYFESGEKLDQDRIAEELEVSRTPVREAMRRLESEGFVKVRPHYGAFIAVVSRQEIHEVYEIRRLLEAEIVRQVTPLIPESVLDELDRSLTEIQAQFDAGDITKPFESDVYFHDTIANFIENKLLKEVLDGLTSRISMVLRFAQLQPGPHLAVSFKEHRAILQAMRQRDSEEAAELMRVHLEESSFRIQELAEQGANKIWGS
jgi:DNA-binding GntR family transcriptional regulator